MQKELLVNSSDGEIRVALLENGVLTELYYEHKTKQGIMGNIYKGRVTRVLPGMQAAFVDIGLSKDAFLYVMDFFDHVDEYEQELSEDEEHSEIEPEEHIHIEEPAACEPVAAEETAHPEAVHPEAIHEEILPPAVITAVEAMPPAPLSVSLPQPVPLPAAEKPAPEKSRSKRNSIENLLKVGQEVLVQVAKEPIGTKGARVTSHISLPGRFLVYMPTVEHVGVSRRIAESSERQRLKEIIKRTKPPNTGFIVRTVGEGKGQEEFTSDVQFLTRLWSSLLKNSETFHAPPLIHQDLDLVLQTIRDIFSPDIDRLWLDSVEEYERVLEFVGDLLPEFTSKVKLYLKSKPMFDYFDIEAQIAKALKRKVWLKSGGYIVIDEAEALVAIDVNTGKYVGKKNLESTIVKTNLEAAQEAMRQIRLRDLGGIIVIDFIDMGRAENRRRIMDTLQELLKSDRTRSNLVQLTELGLVEMTRKRVKQSLGKVLSRACPYCKGNGRIKTEVTVFHEMEREIARTLEKLEGEEVILRVHPGIAKLILDNKKKRLTKMEKTFKKRFTIQADENFHQEQFDIVGV